MENHHLYRLKYPIGEFVFDGQINRAVIHRWIDEIEQLPGNLRFVVSKLSEEQLDTPYRSGGWTLRQVVHHIGDSHLNSYIRFKWALTEDTPTIKAYFEDRWAELRDYQLVPVTVSLDFIASLHKKWVILLRALSDADLQREFIHPESGETPLAKNIGIYAWHGNHHLAHITSLCARKSWQI